MAIEAYLPPRPSFGDVVGRVERRDIETIAPELLHSVKRNASVRMPPGCCSDSCDDLIGDELEDFGRCDAPEQTQDLVHQVRDREKARDRDQRQQRGKEREEEVVCLLRRQAQHVIGDAFVDGSLRQFAPTQRHMKAREHASLKSKSAATSGVSVL